MNIFRQELKINARAFLYWSLTLIFLVAASVGKTSGMIADGGDGLTAMMKMMPGVMQRMFGLGVVDYAKAIGVFAIVWLYIALITAYHAGSLGVAAFAREERDRTFEFLYVRGRKRESILASKVFADLLMIVAINSLTYGFSVFIVSVIGQGSIAAEFGQMMGLLLFIQLFFYCAGLLISFLTRNMRTASSIMSGVVMGFFLLHMFLTVVDVPGWMANLSPFGCFNGQNVLKGTVGNPGMIAWIGLTAAMGIMAFRLHTARDLHT